MNFPLYSSLGQSDNVFGLSVCMCLRSRKTVKSIDEEYGHVNNERTTNVELLKLNMREPYSIDIACSDDFDEILIGSGQVFPVTSTCLFRSSLLRGLL